ncbi:hypothetical protein QFZ35_000995 [Arthrobacter ulcerisalmonis]|nr:neutral zinc metallopeptidase [Arthrobacter ulcerisalmonis]MDQ0662497.1 hypothetical protein [Arthrobacter ulcerisalmonis]
MLGNKKPSLLVLLAASALFAGGCSSSVTQGGAGTSAPEATPSISEPTSLTQTPEPVVTQTPGPEMTQTPDAEVTEPFPTLEQTEPAATRSPQAREESGPIQATVKATTTVEAFPQDESGNGVPEFSSDSCVQSETQDCLETVDEAPLGAAPPQSEVTGTAYPYTVTSYVEWIITDLHTEWNKWFVENNFAPTTVYYKIIHETDPPYVMSCPGGPASIPHDYPNAYYCSSDPYFDLRGTTEDGLIILPVTTMQRMWTGEVLGSVSKQAGDFAAAIIVAHEYGHSVQDELAIQWEKYYPGQVPKFTGSNKEAIADCFAGVWMNTTYYDGILEPGDFEEGVAALNAVGATQPGSSHPTSTQREAALKLGYNSGDPMQCVDAYWK